MHPSLLPLPTRRRTTAASLLALALSTSFASAQSGTLTPLLVTNQPLTSGAPVETLFNFTLFDISPTGLILYRATIGNSQQGVASDVALMSVGAGQARTIVAREGLNLPRGGTLSNITTASITNTNRISAQFALAGSASTQSLVSVDNGALTEVIRNGDSFAGSVTYNSLQTSIAAEPGLIPTIAVLAGASVTTANDDILLRLRVGGPTTTIAREGSPAPGGGTFNATISPIASNDSGDVVFQNTLSIIANPSRLYRFRNTIQEIAAEGTPVPSSGGLGSNLSSFSLNSVGQTAFYNNLTGTTGGTTDNEGIYRAIPGELTQIARKGQAAPGGGTLTDIVSSAPRINNSGRVAFIATQSGSPGAQFDGDTLFTGTGGSLTRLARNGQSYAPSGGTEIITTLDLASYNDAGVALITSTVTVPGSASSALADYVTDGIDTVEILRSGQSIAGSTISGLSSVGGFRRLLPDGRVISRVFLANGNIAMLEFVPSLRYRSTFSSSWDTASNWTLSLPPSALLPVRIDPSTSLTITGPTGTESVLSLQIGGGNGNATLRLAGGNLSTTNGTTLLPNGFLTGDGSLAGPVLNQGTITPTLISFPNTLTNAGLVRGSTTGATLNGPLLNQPAGTLRIQAGESLNLGGPVTNSGRIDAFGNATSVAEVTFASPLTNSASTGLISARNAQLRFNGGLTNGGSLALTSGTNDISGDINNLAGATLTVTGGAHATFYDDVTQNGTLRVVRSGSTTSVAVFLGAFTGAGGATGGGDIFLEGDLRPGNSPAFVNFDANLALGPNSTTLIEIAGTADSAYDRVTVTGVFNLAGTLDVRFIDGFLPTGNAPTTFLILSASALVGDFSQTLLPTAGDRQWFLQRTPTSLSLSSFNVIPEPTTLALLSLPTLALLRLPRATSRGRARR